MVAKTSSKAEAPQHQQPDLARAIQVAIAHPREAIKYIDELLGDPFAQMALWSDVERDFWSATLRRHVEKPLAAVEQREATDTLCDLAERRLAGDIRMNRREHRRLEGQWGFSKTLKAFAKASGLPDPGYDNKFDAYEEQVVRDVLAAHGWVPPDQTGRPLSAWPAADRAMLLSIWPQRNGVGVADA
jgi:hypothetical protein